MTIEFLTKANKIIEAGLRMPNKPEEAPRPMRPEPEETLDMGEPETHIDPGVAKHYEQMRQEKGQWEADEAAKAAIPVEPCPWCCPVTCANCGIENCKDRLAGGKA